jgi:hypothetical protein
MFIAHGREIVFAHRMGDIRHSKQRGFQPIIRNGIIAQLLMLPGLMPVSILVLQKQLGMVKARENNIPSFSSWSIFGVLTKSAPAAPI